MRLSRKAGLLTCGVKWLKYECTYSRVETDRYTYGQYPWEIRDSGTDTGIWFQGTTSYTIIWDGTKYVYASAGDQSHAGVDRPGTVYIANGIYLERYIVKSDGSYTVDVRRVSTDRVYDDVYTVGALVGNVRAAEGEYPDEKNGYTYVTTDNGYTIMKDVNGDYYAYKLT